MLKKVKKSLTAKVFIWVMIILLLCSFMVYGVLMLALPKSYNIIISTKVEDAINSLTTELNNADAETGLKKTEEFCIEFNANATISIGNALFNFGEKPDTNEIVSFASSVKFTDQAQISFLTILAPASARAEITSAFFELLPYIAVFILLISAISAYICSRIFVKPIVEISQISKRMSELDMTWHCNITTEDELGVLANSLNTMAKKLDAAMKELESANIQLYEDIVATKQLEKQRRDFFAAVSHELKTPLTIIKGQIEGMMLGVGDYADHTKYLPQTLAATEDMEQLIAEILTITKMESAEFSVALEGACINTVLQKSTALNKPFADSKNIALHLDMNGETTANIQPQLFERAISNVINNAIRHSPSGAEVYITLDGPKLQITNTQTTIDEMELTQLFTPFYRIDKSRNRSAGGSGLGLYIVKTILDAHKMRYFIENSENSVVFTINLNQT